VSWESFAFILASSDVRDTQVMTTPPPLPPLTDAPVDATHTAASGSSTPRWHSTQLLAGSPEALIEHGDATYRLRLTLLGKLILTK